MLFNSYMRQMDGHHCTDGIHPCFSFPSESHVTLNDCIGNGLAGMNKFKSDKIELLIVGGPKAEGVIESPVLDWVTSSWICAHFLVFR